MTGLPAASAAQPALDGLRMNPQRAGEGNIGRGMDHAANDPPRLGIGRAPIAKLPVDDLVASPFDGRAASAGRAAPDSTRGVSRSTSRSSNAGSFSSVGSSSNRDLRELPAALVQQRGNVDRHVLAGIEKIGHEQDATHSAFDASAATWSGMSGRVMEKKAGRMSAPQPRRHPRDHGLKALVGLGARAAVADDEDSAADGYTCAMRFVHGRCSQRERK